MSQRSLGFRYDCIMKQLRFLMILAALAIPPTWAIHHVQARRAQEIRETAYQAKLRSYTEALKPGVFRADVEQYLQKQGTKPQQMCCVGMRTNTYDDLVKIGQEEAPWFCEEKNIYVAFEFSGDEHVQIPKTAATDRLREITIFRWLEGCL